MCATCGCEGDGTPTLTDPATGRTEGLGGGHDHDHAHAHGHGHDHDHGHGHAHGHGHDHGHDHDHGRGVPRTLRLEQEVLARNDQLAAQVRGWLAGRGVLALNLVSSPGSGKTTLVEQTVRALGSSPPVSVLVGDQATARDAERVRAAGAAVLQINTGTGCHLDAHMVLHALERLDPPAGSVLLIENVGNLVCPALFDLGERARVLVASTPEGEDKPLKYPHMFRSAALVLLNKVDLVEALGFDVAAFEANVREVAPRATLLHVAARRPGGVDPWLAWLREQAAAPRGLTAGAGGG